MGRVVSPVLVGRDAELGRLVAAVAAAPSVVVVEGEAGIGKSRLVAELAGREEVAGRRFLVGGCGRIREPFPLGPLVEALRESGGDLAAVTLTPVTGALRGLVPELAPVLPELPEPVADQAAVRHRQYRGLSEVLGALCPAVLVVEDLHWADEQTVEFLTYLLAKPPGGLSVVLTYRGEEVSTAVRAITARPADSVTVGHIGLGPLDAARTRRLAAAILDLDDVSAPFAEQLCERASGLPLAIQELLALLRARGEVIRWEGGWARRALDRLEVPAGVRDPVRERVARLPEGARAVVQAAAVLGIAVPVTALAGVSGLADAADGVDLALELGLLVERDGLVGFRHVLAAQAVYEAVPPARRRVLHARAADAVQVLPQAPLGQLAHHLRQAGRVGEWVETADRAAAQAAELGDAAEAVRLLEDVLRHADVTAERRVALTVRLGWAAIETLKERDIEDLLAAALDHDDLPRRTRGELWFLLALHLDGRTTDLSRRHRAFAEAVADLDDRPDLAAWCMAALGIPTAPQAPIAEHRRWLERALRLAPKVTDPAVRLFVLGVIAMVFAALGDPRWSELAALVERELEDREPEDRELNERELDERVPRRRETYACRALGEELCSAGHFGMAQRLLATALRGTAGHDVSGVEEFRCRVGLSMVAYCRGAWDGLRETIEVLRHAHVSGAYEVRLHAVAACLSPVPGELEQARARLREVVGRQRDLGAVDHLPLTVSVLVRLGAACGEPGAAVAETADVVAMWEAKELWPVGVRTVPALAEALLAAATGNPAGGAVPSGAPAAPMAPEGRAAAVALVERYADRLSGLDAPLAAPALAHARGFLVAAEERWSDAAELFVAAAGGYRELPARYEAAQCDEQAAACRFAALAGAGSDTEAAGRSLLAAIAAYEEMGARWDLDRAMRLARRHGVRPAAARRNGGAAGDVLTERQREVARMAAAGRTNAEIARELFLSPKTVDKHLSAALHRLGLRSRIELRRHMGEG
ncbi:LuxR family transcriptional regulator [Streptomyces brasiliensis]|uniref:LuxR family transcriptional regulator n=1 Tax=Streptomyces brasiliensis TaxID=1954 RepID=A0A917P1T1_9ACTN|nr:LuxR family transcriptional regulator [Streptomyces brasiliensis]